MRETKTKASYRSEHQPGCISKNLFFFWRKREERMDIEKDGQHRSRDPLDSGGGRFGSLGHRGGEQDKLS